MKKIIILLLFLPISILAQDDERLGAWYMYFFNAPITKSGFGIQGDIQYRHWNLGGDLEQLLLRGGAYYKDKKTNALYTLGIAHIASGVPGESEEISQEFRSYGEYLHPHKLGERFYLTHRFRAEARWIESQDFRDRFRYALFVNIPINQKSLLPKTYYVALYNELFLNGFSSANPRTYDRNRAYFGLGYVLNPKVRFQLGFMNQDTHSTQKNQWQVSVHHQS
jgi:hypothetical protein